MSSRHEWAASVDVPESISPEGGHAMHMHISCVSRHCLVTCFCTLLHQRWWLLCALRQGQYATRQSTGQSTGSALVCTAGSASAPHHLLLVSCCPSACTFVMAACRLPATHALVVCVNAMSRANSYPFTSGGLGLFPPAICPQTYLHIEIRSVNIGK